MSWLYFVHSPDPGVPYSPGAIHPPALKIVSRPGFYLAMGGIPETCCSNDYPDSGWAVVGTGIKRSGDDYFLMSPADWASLLQTSDSDFSSLDGHFVILCWNSDSIQLFTDQLGLRTVYYGMTGDRLCISTRADWVSRTTGGSAPDPGSLGSRWLLYNQMDYTSALNNIARVGPGGCAVFRGGKPVGNECRRWPVHSAEHSPCKLPEAMVKAGSSTGLTPTLGLSGGMDSRLLLAILSRALPGNFATHSFGEPEDPDAAVAARLASALGVEHQCFNDPLPDAGETVRSMKSFASAGMLIEPVTSIARLRYYPRLRAQHRLMIDGGFGEIGRRQYLNRLVRFGGGALRSRDIPRIANLMRITRGDFLSREVLTMMERGMLDSLAAAIDDMPEPATIGMGNYADILAIRYRIPNFGGPEQARIDSEIINFMPLVQPSFLRYVFGLKTALRANGRLYRSMISRLAPILTKDPLVKGGAAYPFGLPITAARVLGAVQSKLGRAFHDPWPDRVLRHCGEYIRDVATSSGAVQSGFYDCGKLRNAVERYYNGETAYRSTVEWWLTFELWRQSL